MNKAEVFIKQAKEKFGDKFDYSEVKELKSMEDGVKIICPDHGLFLIIARRHLQYSTGCPLCGKSKSRVTKEHFIENASKIHNGVYDYSKVNFRVTTDKVIIGCPIHGDFEQTVHNHYKGKQGCPECGKIKVGINNPLKYSKERFLEKVNTKFQNKFTYNLDNFQNLQSEITIVCPEHGEFKNKAWCHLKSATGCPKCGIIFQAKNNTKNIDYFKSKATLVHQNIYDYSISAYVNNYTKLDIICPIHGVFSQTPNNHVDQKQGCPKCNTSECENEIINLFNIEFEHRDTKLINMEIDLLNHSHKFGIEFNGLMFHSFGISKYSIMNNFHKHSFKKYRHLEKTEALENIGYQLFHIREDQWLNPIKKEIWKSVINNKIGSSVKYFARKLKVKIIESKQTISKFLEENHLQGNCGSSYALGLYDSDKLISIMTFGKSRYNKDIEWELIRFCTIKNCTVIGGASKLLTHFERIQKPKSLISYANRDWSQGNLYEKLGFTFIKKSKPNYVYVHFNSGKILSRIQCQKHKLNFLEKYDENLSELQNMLNNNYRIYYDSGNLVYHKYYEN